MAENEEEQEQMLANFIFGNVGEDGNVEADYLDEVRSPKNAP
jgi:hypothetical protein